MKRILVIEDDPDIAHLVELHLLDQNYQVDLTESGQTGAERALNGQYDLIVLDLMLPDLNGMDVCRRIRLEKVATPIIMLTARSEEIDKVLGLESGADDYITKPFSIREFLARVKAILRRTGDPETLAQKGSLIRTDVLEIDIDNRIVRRAGERVELTPKEFELLALLARYPGRSFSREQLLNRVWGDQFAGYEHTVNSHINRLRAKIEADPSQPKFVLTTWGIGYRFSDAL
ncbi:MAG: response regulator transcription factor [Bacteroidota bacterium]